MCRVCNIAKESKPADALKMIETAIKGGKDPEHFKKVMDSILDTEEPEVDEEKDTVFERAYRDGRG